MATILSSSLILLLLAQGILGDDITFYEHSEFQGDTLTQNIGPFACTNMPPEWNDKASSINTGGHCVTVFDDIGCSGDSIEIKPGSPSHNNLPALGWNDRISSTRLCSQDGDGDGGGGGGGDAGWRQGGLDAHNGYRARHGVPSLVLDDAVNDSAQKCADYLADNKIFDHVCGKVFGHHYGENLAAGSGFNSGSQAAIDSTNMWYNEEPKHDYNNNNFQYASGHFSQVVWKNSARLGFGYAVNGDFKVVVGHYDPPGNYQGQFIENVLRPRK